MLRRVFDLKVVIGSLFFTTALLCGTIVYIMVFQPSTPPGDLGQVSAVITILPAPTSTPSSTPRAVEPADPASETSETPPPGQIAIGVYVQIVGTNGEGLRLRSMPGLDSQALLVGYDSEVFLVSDGPVEADGLSWWYLSAPYDQTRSGWAAEEYLTVIPYP